MSRLYAEIVKDLQHPDVNGFMQREGAEPVGSSPVEFAALFGRDIDKVREDREELGCAPRFVERSRGRHCTPALPQDPFRVRSARTTLDDLPAAVVERARWLARRHPAADRGGRESRRVRAFAERQLSAKAQGEASVIGFNRRTSPNVAALVNGTAGTWLEMDRSKNAHAKGLPASQVVPAALAMAEHARSGRRSPARDRHGLRSMLAHQPRGALRLAIHSSGNFGTIGAAVAAGKLANLDADAMRALINVSATLGLASSRQAVLEGATVGRVYAGAAGYLGLLALDMVQSGMTGERDGVRSVYGQVYGDTPNGSAFDPIA